MTLGPGPPDDSVVTEVPGSASNTSKQEVKV